MEELEKMENYTIPARNISESTVRVRVLDQIEFIPRTVYKSTFLSKAHKYLGLQPFAFHPNWWNRNKTEALKEMGLWMIDEEERCVTGPEIEINPFLNIS